MATTTPEAVVEATGRVRFGNALAEGLLGLPAGGLGGRTLIDLMGKAVGGEATRLVARTIGEDRSLVSVSMIRGHWARGRFTPVEEGGDRCCVLAAEPWTCPLGRAAPEASAPEELGAHDLADLGTLTAREAEVLWRLS